MTVSLTPSVVVMIFACAKLPSAAASVKTPESGCIRKYSRWDQTQRTRRRSRGPHGNCLLIFEKAFTIQFNNIR